MTCYKTQTSELALRHIISDRHLFIVTESFSTQNSETEDFATINFEVIFFYS